jgi:recombinational DNA repair protein RecR
MKEIWIVTVHDRDKNNAIIEIIPCTSERAAQEMYFHKLPKYDVYNLPCYYFEMNKYQVKGCESCGQIEHSSLCSENPINYDSVGYRAGQY